MAHQKVSRRNRWEEIFFISPLRGGRGWAIYRAGRRLGVNWTPRSGTVAGLRVEVVIESGLFVEIGIGVGALGAVAGRVGDLDKALAVEHIARPPAVGDESPRPVDLAEEEGCCRLDLHSRQTTTGALNERGAGVGVLQYLHVG